jgi:hypothetical protein
MYYDKIHEMDSECTEEDYRRNKDILDELNAKSMLTKCRTRERNGFSHIKYELF